MKETIERLTQFENQQKSIRDHIDSLLKKSSQSKMKNPFAEIAARDVFENIVRLIQDFELTLDKEEAIGIEVSHGGTSLKLLLGNISFCGSSLIKFSCILNKEKIELVQHIQQINFILVKIRLIEPKKDSTKPIGFSVA